MERSERVWRIPPAGRIAGLLLTVGWIGLAIGSSAIGNSFAIVFWVGAAIMAVGVWRWAFVPYVAVGPKEIVVQNRLGKRTLDYAQIRDVRTGPYGLILLLNGGGSVTAWAVQKGNLAKWLHVRTRADEVAEAITGHIDQIPKYTP